MTTTDLDALEAKAAKAQAALQAALDAAQAVRDQKQAERDARAREVAQAVVDNYDDREMFERIEQAREDFSRAFADSDLGKAWIAIHAAELRHAHDALAFNDAASLLGLPQRMGSRPAGSVYLEVLTQLVERHAVADVAEEEAARDAQRAAYIAGTED